MPRVTATHIYRLLDYADGADTILASSDGVRPRPPTLFGKHRFDWLMSLTGDRGAREMILKAPHVIAATNALFDFDTPEDLATLLAMPSCLLSKRHLPVSPPLHIPLILHQPRILLHPNRLR